MGPVTVMVLLKMGPMGPQGPWTMGPMGPRGLGPNPFSTVSPCPPGFFFGKNSVPTTYNTYLLNKWRVFAIVVNVDVNLRLKICKIAI